VIVGGAFILRRTRDAILPGGVFGGSNFRNQDRKVVLTVIMNA